MLPRAKPKRSGIKRAPQRSYPGHLQFVRGFVCCAHRSGECDDGKRVPHHVRLDTDHAGMKQKPHDKWAVPLCNRHHLELHYIGALTFEAKYGVNLKAEAEKIARASRWRLVWEKEESE